MTQRGIMWFREDLRTHDNTALWHAMQHSNDGVIAVFIVDTAMWKKHLMADCRIEFLLRGLLALSKTLAILNVPLLIHTLEKNSSVCAVLLKIAQETGAKKLFFNKQYEIDERKRDAAIELQLQQHRIQCYSFDDQVILAPGCITTQEGNYFKVFTAFKNAWIRYFSQHTPTLLGALKTQLNVNIQSSIVPDVLTFKSIVNAEHWPAGEAEALKRLQLFVKKNLFLYDKQRDYPAIAGTSQLSAYLSLGMISPRECFFKALHQNNNELTTGNKGALIWMSELIWREFYKHLLVAVPRLSMNHAFKLATEKIRWKFDEKQLIAWQKGNTGYPLIDAAMRQLNQTGWMHNRLRMVVAMFFTKNLFFHWRLGEDYFMQHLIDGDLAANNGGWQWCASTGTDAAPYFRVFNPVSQSEKFDSEGAFIRRFCPELHAFDNHSIHDPHGRMPLLAKQAGYPYPIVDLKTTRAYAIAAFKNI